MGIFIKNENLRTVLITILDIAMMITFIYFAITVHNFQKNCCEVYDKVCPRPKNEICFCMNVSELTDRKEPVPIPIVSIKNSTDT